MARSTQALQFRPYMGNGLEGFVRIRILDDDALGSLHALEIGHDRQTKALRCLVDENKQHVIFACSNRLVERLLQICRENDFLWFHSPMSFAMV